MRIHELLEASIDYIAVEGILGCDPFALQRHLSTLDASINASGFPFTWKLLVQHPSIQVILTTYPLPSEDGTIVLGAAPLPADYQPPEDSKPAVDYDALFSAGLRGRQIAYHLAGEEFRTSRQAVEDKRVANAKQKEQQRKRMLDGADDAGPSGTPGVDGDSQELVRILVDDDGSALENAVEIQDLSGLMTKWGSRLRIRCTDQEIYFRLTGSHQKIPKISPIVLHILQLAARSREKGMTAVELGPLVGSSQGSMHYYMKVLVGLGLCAKVPVIQHAASTNILVFHKFLHLNENYRAVKGASLAESSLRGKEETPSQTIADDIAYSVRPHDLVPEMGMTFPPMTEPELMSGFVVRERLVKLLDHPGLENHMLRVMNLLGLLGWQSASNTRHRRAVLRVINAMVEEGSLERLDVGELRIRCIRLTKYNQDFVPDAKAATEEETVEEIDRQPLALEDLDSFDMPFTYTEGIPLTLTVEHLISKSIVDSGHLGLTFADIREKVGNLYKRSVDAIIARIDEDWLPLNLRPLAICTLMESEGKERRIRCFGTTSYREYITSEGHKPDDVKHPPEPPESGHWADLWYRDFYESPEDFARWSDAYDANCDEPPLYKAGARARSDRPRGRPKKEVQSSNDTTQTPKQPAEPPKRKRDGYMSMTNTVQVRGRPRKYIHVVDENGKPRRNVIGVLLPHPDIAPVLIWIKDQDILVAAPHGYSGVGVPPKLTSEELESGKHPEWFAKYPRAPKEGVKTPGVGKGNGGKKGKGKGKDKAVEEDEEDKDEDQQESDERSSASKPKAKKARVAAPLSTPGATPMSTPSVAGGLQQGQMMAPPLLPSLPLQPDPHTMPQATTPVDMSSKSTLETFGFTIIPPPKRQKREDKLASAATAAPEALPQSSAQDTRTIEPQILGQIDSRIFTSNGASSSTPPASAPSATQPIPDVSTSSVPTAPAAPQADSAAPPTPSVPKKRGRPRKDAPASPVVAAFVPAPQASDAASITAPDPGPSASKSNQDTTPTDVTPAIKRKRGRPRKDGASPSSTSTPVTSVSPEVVTAALAKEPSLFLQSPSTSPQDAFFPRPSESSKENVPLPSDRQTATPLRELKPTDPPGAMLPPPTVSNAHIPNAPRGGRIDLGSIRKVRELCQALLEAGGVLSDLKLYHEHRAWAHRSAGTATPFAPTVGYGMDRNVYHKTVEQAVREGRIKQTKTGIPTTTGRWVQTPVLYLPETEWSVLQDYIRKLALTTADSMKAPRRQAGTQIPETSFTEVRRDAATMAAIRHSRPYPSYDPDSERVLTRRDVLFKEPYVAAYLLGFQSGRWLRMQILHRAIVDAMVRNPLSASNISKTPRVFSITFLFEDISIKDWFACLDMLHWHPELEAWLKDPVKSQMRIQDLPKEMRPRWGLRGHKSKNKLVALISIMCELKILTPLQEFSPDIEDPLFKCPRPAGDGEMAFRAMDSSQSALFFLVHDFAPVYHVALESPALMGVLPIQTVEETDTFWRVEKQACLSSNPHDLSSIAVEQIPPPPAAAPTSPTLDLDASLLVLLRSPVRWEHHFRLLPAQSEALKEAIDWTTGQRLYSTPEQVAAFAFENALPVDYVETWLSTKSLKAIQKLSDRRERYRVAAQDFKARQDKSRELLRLKLAQKREQAKDAWEKRVREAAARAGYEYSQELSDFVRKRTLSATAAMPVNDKALDEGVELYKKGKELGEVPKLVTGRVKDYPAPPKTKRIPLQKKIQNFPVQVVAPPPDGRRRRVIWTPENDELFFDAEAIIRCRSGTRQNLGRTAMLQIFPAASASILLHKIKKVKAVPAKEAYLEALKSEFYKIWVQYRGTPELPDEDFEDHVGFDLAAHIQFLREKIDKRALRASLKVQGRGQKVGGPPPPPLPTSIEELLESYVIEDVDTQTIPYTRVVDDTLMAEETKVERLSATPIIEMDDAEAADTSQSFGMLTACLKMIVATPKETYDQTPAAELIAQWDEIERSLCLKQLLEDKVFLRERTAAATGRFFTFAANWQLLSEGPFPASIYEEAADADIYINGAVDSFKEWPLIGTSGGTAELLAMVSDHQVDFDIDTSSFPALKYKRHTHNTRAMNDDVFEGKISVQRIQDAHCRPTQLPDLFSLPISPLWPESLVAAPPGLEARLLEVVKAAKEHGVTKPELLTSLACSSNDLDAVLALLSAQSPPSVFWAGYDTARLISTSSGSQWMVQTSPKEDAPARDTRPRRWTDIYGTMYSKDWETVVRCLAGTVQFKPGVTERNLRNKVQVQLDRLEFNEVARDLLDRGVLRRDWIDPDMSAERVMPPVECMDVDEEPDVAWWVVPGMGLA